MNLKELKNLNSASLEMKEMELVQGGIGGNQTDTMTVTGNRETGETTVTNDGKDAAPSGIRRALAG